MRCDMNAKETAKRWGCSPSTVKEYCRTDIIPSAEKIKSKANRLVWDVPAECTKPPMTRHGMCTILDTAFLIQDGANFEVVKWGRSINDVKDCFRYLAENAFITDYDNTKSFEELVYAIKVTLRGEDLIRSDAQDKKKPLHYKVKGELNFKVASVSVEVEN